MILPDHEIRKAIKDKKIEIESLDNEDQIKSSCIDLRLSNEFKVFKHTDEPFIDSKNPKEYTEDVLVDKRPFILHPGEFILGITREKITLSDDIVGYVDGRSSLGRLGITAHITSGFVDPGFSGRLVLEICNLGKMPVTIYPDMRICKLILFRMSSPCEVPYNKRKDAKYKDQNNVSESKIYEETS